MATLQLNPKGLLDSDHEATTDDDCASSQRQASSAACSEQADCDCFGFSPSYQEQVQSIAVQVREHYGAKACIIAIESRALPGGCKQVRSMDLTILACAGYVDLSNLQQAGESEKQFQLFHYNVQRKAPIIIDDVAEYERLKEHPLATKSENPLRFYASAPIVLAKKFGAYVGAVTIIDSKPRSEVSLDDCRTLSAKANEVAGILNGVMTFNMALRSDRR